MYQWIVKDDAQAARAAADRKQQDVWAWTVIGFVAALTLLVVWVPLLIAAFRT